MTMPFHIYLDLEVRNDDTIAAGRTPPPLSFEETRTQPFLEGDASEYFCTIARFTLQKGNSLPVSSQPLTPLRSHPHREGSYGRSAESDHIQDQLLGGAEPL